MTPAGILTELRRHGADVEVDAGRPRLTWDEGAPPPAELIEVARQHREALIALVVAGGESTAPRASGVEAIPEPARAGILRLGAMPSPGDFPPARWSEAIEAARYLAIEWLDPATNLGWPMLDLFGCHPVKPRAALHMAGLALCLRPGDRISALAESSAVMVTPGGAPRTFRRSPAIGPRTLLWDLDQYSEQEGCRA